MISPNDQKPPSDLLWTRIGKDGIPRPLSLTEQWEQVSKWHSFLESEQAPEYPVLDGLNEHWESLSPLHEFQGKNIIERGAELRTVSDSPLAALFYFVDLGFYPPPELMLSLLDCWSIYEGGHGHLSLEHVFLGPPVPKAGNYAKRRSARFLKMCKAWELTEALREGKTRMEAAQLVAEKFGGDADTIARTIRPFRREKPEK